FKAWWNLPLHWNLLFQVSEVPSAPLFCKHSIFQRPLAMPLSRLFEVLFDNPAVAKYPIF
ncbi:MAG: hypothetical protein ACLTZS_02980, partial [Roseburia faecis]